MKKLLLFLCAFLASLTVGAQPTTNPTDPTDKAARVIAVFSDYYHKELTESNNDWGGGPNPKYTSFSVPVIQDGHKVIHVNGTAINGRASGKLNSEYSTLHVVVFPTTATSLKVWDDNQYPNATVYSSLIPGQWNYVVVENVSFSTDYIGIELYNGENPETEFWMDHFYFAKPPVEDVVAPVLNTCSVASTTSVATTLTLKATDETSANVSYRITDTNNGTVYNASSESGSEISFTIGGLAANTAYVFNVVALDDNDNESSSVIINVTTESYPSIPVADKLTDNVKTVYGQYGRATGLSQTSGTSFNGMSREVIMFKNNNAQFSLPAEPEFNVSDMDYIHYDVLSDVNTPVALFVENRTENWKGKDVDGGLVAGVWTSFDVPVSFFIEDCGQSMEKVINLALIKEVANKSGHDGFMDFSSPFPTLYIANVYFWKNPAEDTEAPVMTKAEATTVKDTKVTLTVSATDNSNGTLTYSVKKGASEIATGTGKAGVDAIIEVTGLTAETTYNLTVTATDAKGNVSTAMNVAEFTTESTPSVIGTSGTGVTGTNGGGAAGLKYSYEFVEDATGVNVTFTCTNPDDYTGLVSYVWDNTNGFSEIEGGQVSITKHLDYAVGTTIKVACKWAYAGGMSVTDYIEYTLQGVSTSTVTANVGTYHWATFCSDKDLDFTNVTDVKAYIVTGLENGAVATQQITGAVKAGTGLLLNSDAAGEFTIPVATDEAADYSTTNKMIGVTESTKTVEKAETGYVNYILSVFDGKAAFKYVNSTPAELVKGQAYLHIEGNIETAAPMLSIDGDGETSGISSLENNRQIKDGIYYDLSGRRVSQPTKGLYILNGKKVIIK